MKYTTDPRLTLAVLLLLLLLLLLPWLQVRSF